ncbi:hypothetical protein [Spiroplasma melliferum]|uniref:hypothetical protein n=1 Tax=Spiroplasma melliferum TaxID=2134 RepID=UPI0002A635AB|nr:hypothetical protein [Spiroplasma melliferum]ELL44555.1 hypothetical protein SMIPMB4A_v3c4440 [Spiroplasma melliferum IPMB4A]
MKRLLTLFSVLVLGIGSSFEVASCTARAKHEYDDNDDQDVNKDLLILNNIKNEAKQYFTNWWQDKSTIDIKMYPDQMESLAALITKLKITDGLTLTGVAIRAYRFLEQLLVGFQAEFDNFNQQLANKYSNYYVNTMPLFLGENDISFDLYNINFENIAKLLADTPQAVLGITVQVNITYEVRFKELQQFNYINRLVIICNDVEALSGIQNNLENYFITFINDLFKKENYQIIIENRSYNKVYTSVIWPMITEELTTRGILFRGSANWNSFDSSFTLSRIVEKSDSVLAWAGEGYRPDKLTSEKFLQFYKKNYFSTDTLSDYYVKYNVDSFTPDNLTIENLPFKYKTPQRRNLKTPIKVLVPKDKVDQQLEEFAKVTMDFWHYYQIETYNDKLVFKVNQDDFNNLIKKLTSFSENKFIRDIFVDIIQEVFDIFQTTLDSTTTWNSYINLGDTVETINLIKKQKSFMFQYLWKRKGYYSWSHLNFGYNTFFYSFFFQPNYDETNTKENKFLQTIEFKVV